MKKSDLFKTAFRNLKNRKTRTRLTVIGVVIGTCAIVIMVSIGVGIDKMLTAQFESNTSLSKITVYQGYNDDGTQNEETLLNDRALEYLSSIEHVEAAIPTIDMQEYASLTRGKYSLGWGLMAIDTSSMEKMGFELKEGSFAGTDRNTVFFGERAAANFMDSQGNSAKFKYDSDFNLSECEIDPMKDIFTVTVNENTEDGGVKTGTASPVRIKAGGVVKNDYRVEQNSDSGAYIDMALAKELIKQYNMVNKVKNRKFTYSNIYLMVDNMENVKAVKEVLEQKGFSSYSDDEELEYTKKIMLAVQLVLGAIGAVSMFVAAFGISNTMVMSVMERTKEIGVMKVLGCELGDIKAMFLYEAGTIGLMGGVIGLIISYILSIATNIVARAVMGSMEPGEDFYVCVSSIPPWLAILGIVFSVGVGVIAGLSPAKRSVKVSALTAIHNE